MYVLGSLTDTTTLSPVPGRGQHLTPLISGEGSRTTGMEREQKSGLSLIQAGRPEETHPLRRWDFRGLCSKGKVNETSILISKKDCVKASFGAELSKREGRKKEREKNSLGHLGHRAATVCSVYQCHRTWALWTLKNRLWCEGSSSTALGQTAQQTDLSVGGQRAYSQGMASKQSQTFRYRKEKDKNKNQQKQ